MIAACAELPVDLRIVEGLHHDEAGSSTRRRTSSSTSSTPGWYGLFAIEAMALGKPVVTFLHEEAVARTEDAFGTTVPIVSATAESLATHLRPLVEDADYRRRVGAARAATTSSACTTPTRSPTACSTSTLAC